MIKKTNKNEARVQRHLRMRRRLKGSTEQPRLCVFRSNKHIYCQIVDDTSGQTLVAASTLDPELKKEKKTWDRDAAKKVGELVAERAKKKGIAAVVFDRGGYIYHGRVAAVADGARGKGLQF